MLVKYGMSGICFLLGLGFIGGAFIYPNIIFNLMLTGIGVVGLGLHLAYASYKGRL